MVPSVYALLLAVHPQVYDDMMLLHQLFPDELSKLIQGMHLNSKPQVIVLSPFWFEELAQFINLILNPVLIITCAIEAAMRAKVDLVSYKYYSLCFAITKLH